MMTTNMLVFLTGLLLLVGIASSKFSARLGMPVLVLFLGIGMLAGSEGLGGIAFEDYLTANNIASVALALILFDGGLRTSMAAVRSAWRPALALSTAGVLLTALLTGLAAAAVLKVPLLYGVLLGAIVGSTDAAAVFSILRTSGLTLPERLRSTLEVESGSNDPMAIFLTIALVGLAAGNTDSPGAVATIFALQFGVGSLVGVAVGTAAAWAVNRVNLDHPGLYPVLALAFGLLAFGLAAILGGSGFLAAYIAGILLGNRLVAFRHGILLFHDAAAWLSQIVLFVLLGLLSFPSRLAAVAPDGLLIALVLILVARPIAVFLTAAPFRFHFKELVFLSWVGLKGAVPITLATIPLLAGIDPGGVVFDVVFFVVLVSAMTQGWSLPFVARRLRLGRPAAPSPRLSLEINALRNVDGEIVEYTVGPESQAAGRLVRELALPDGVLVTLVLRGGDVTMPGGATSLREGDHVFIAVRKKIKPLVDRLIDPDAPIPKIEPGYSLMFHARSTVGQVSRFLSIPGEGPDVPIGSLLAGVDGAAPVRLGGFIVTKSRDPSRVEVRYSPEGVRAS